eukprot:2641496-Amphidinium_carterae.1
MIGDHKGQQTWECLAILVATRHWKHILARPGGLWTLQSDNATAPQHGCAVVHKRHWAGHHCSRTGFGVLRLQLAAQGGRAHPGQTQRASRCSLKDPSTWK